ncbi:MAG: hypothetical protein AAB675_02040 [Patescibacteria group bacterium]|mgnify:FL=1
MRNLKELGLPIALATASIVVAFAPGSEKALADNDKTSATPTPAAEATPTVEGDQASKDNPDSKVPWALGTLGLATLAGGVWVVARTRRENL